MFEGPGAVEVWRESGFLSVLEASINSFLEEDRNDDAVTLTSFTKPHRSQRTKKYLLDRYLLRARFGACHDDVKNVNLFFSSIVSDRYIQMTRLEKAPSQRQTSSYLNTTHIDSTYDTKQPA